MQMSDLAGGSSLKSRGRITVISLVGSVLRNSGATASSAANETFDAMISGTTPPISFKPPAILTE